MTVLKEANFLVLALFSLVITDCMRIRIKCHPKASIVLSELSHLFEKNWGRNYKQQITVYAAVSFCKNEKRGHSNEQGMS